MTAKAFILIETTRGKSKEINAALRRLEGIISADPLPASYVINNPLECEAISL